MGGRGGGREATVMAGVKSNRLESLVSWYIGVLRRLDNIYLQAQNEGHHAIDYLEGKAVSEH